MSALYDRDLPARKRKIAERSYLHAHQNDRYTNRRMPEVHGHAELAR